MPTPPRPLRRTESHPRLPFPTRRAPSPPIRTSTPTIFFSSPAKSHPPTPLRIRSNSSAGKLPSLDAIRAIQKNADRHPLPSAVTPLTGPVPPKPNRASAPSNPIAVHPLLSRRTTSHLPHPTAQPRPLPSVPLPTEIFDEDEDDDINLMFSENADGPVFVSSEDPAPDLKLDIISGEVEKWELPERNMYALWKGTGWRLQIAVSYAPAAGDLLDLEFEPSLNIINMGVACDLVVRPRQIPNTFQSPRRPMEHYSVKYSGELTTHNSRGQLKPMNPTAGIYRDPKFRGPHTVKELNKYGQMETRLGYWTFIYIPIPLYVFKGADTRAFDINVAATVTVANRPAVTLQKRECLTFSHFGQIHRNDDSMVCALMR